MHWSLKLNQSVDYAGRFTQGTAPSSAEVPDGKFGFWFNTSDLKMYLVYNVSGSIRAVEASSVV